MRIHEDFTRCSCGCALIKKDEYVTATYDLRPQYDLFVPIHRVIEYTCKDCKTIIHTESIEIAGE